MSTEATLNVACIIPYRDKGVAERNRNLRYTVKTLLDTLTDQKIVGTVQITADIPTEPMTSDYLEVPFGRQKAYNRGVANAPEADVFVFHEADVVVQPETLKLAIETAYIEDRLVIPFRDYEALTKEDTEAVIADELPVFAWRREYDSEMHGGRSMGAVNVVSRVCMEAVGQWDELLTGHGYDDNCMFEAFTKTSGEPIFLAGRLRHLWHPVAYSPWLLGRDPNASDPNRHSEHEVGATESNMRRLHAYRAARSPEEVRRLTAGAAV